MDQPVPRAAGEHDRRGEVAPEGDAGVQAVGSPAGRQRHRDGRQRGRLLKEALRKGARFRLIF